MVISLRGPWRWIAAVAGVICLSGLIQGGLVSPAVQTVAAVLAARQVPVYKVDTPEKRIAFSFDATWGTENTAKLLDILDRHQVKTTFFLAGNWLESNPEWVREIARRGHEIGNHSYAHAHMNSLSREAIREDLLRAHGLIKRLTGQDPWLFRPPFGEYGNKLLEEARNLGYLTVQWSIDSLDWKNVSAPFMIDRVMERAGPGDIVLFHNAGRHTPEAVDVLLGRLRAQGYDIVPVGQLVYRDNYEIDPHSGLQRPLRPAPAPPRSGAGAGTGAARSTVLPAAGRGAPEGFVIPEEAVFHVDVDEPLYSLAVNVDWGNEHLPAMLELFRRHGVRVTFFPTGRWASRYPEWIARFVQEGHEVGNHGMSHAHPKQLSDAELLRLIQDNAHLLGELTGGRAVRLFAPPYGEFDNRIVEVARRAGHATIMWTVDTVDWKRPAPEIIARRIVEGVRPGAIVLLHPVEETVQALRQALPRLRAAGFQGVPVGQLLRSGQS